MSILVIADHDNKSIRAATLHTLGSEHVRITIMPCSATGRR